jgi:hypothetical protein
VTSDARTRDAGNGPEAAHRRPAGRLQRIHPHGLVLFVVLALALAGCRHKPAVPRDADIVKAILAVAKVQYQRSAGPLRGTLSNERILEALGEPPVVTAFERRRCDRIEPVGDPGILFAFECLVEVEFNKTGRVLKTIVLAPSTSPDAKWRVVGYR